MTEVKVTFQGQQFLALVEYYSPGAPAVISGPDWQWREEEPVEIRFKLFRDEEQVDLESFTDEEFAQLEDKIIEEIERPIEDF